MPSFLQDLGTRNLPVLIQLTFNILPETVNFKIRDETINIVQVLYRCIYYKIFRHIDEFLKFCSYVIRTVTLNHCNLKTTRTRTISTNLGNILKNMIYIMGIFLKIFISEKLIFMLVINRTMYILHLHPNFIRTYIYICVGLHR